MTKVVVLCGGCWCKWTASRAWSLFLWGLFGLLVWIVFVHFDGQSASCVFSLFGGADDHRCDILHPTGPVALNELGHVVGLRIWVLKVQIGRLRSTLVGVPVRWDPPRFSAWVQVLYSHDSHRHLNASALASFEKAVMFEVYFEHILDLKYLTHPRWNNILESRTIAFVVMYSHFAFTRIVFHDSSGSAIDYIVDCFFTAVLL